MNEIDPRLPEQTRRQITALKARAKEMRRGTMMKPHESLDAVAQELHFPKWQALLAAAYKDAGIDPKEKT